MKAEKIEQIRVDDLIPYVRNARTHSTEQIAQIAGSIKEFGFNNPILIDKDNGVIAGHGRLAAARKLKLESVPCVRLEHLTDAQRKAYILADNRIALNSDWETELLATELEELKDLGVDLEGLGFNSDEIDALLNKIEGTEGLTDEDDAPEVQEQAVTKPGDIWVMGNHRLMCGDSTSIDAVDKLMAGQKADMVFTDPPYNIASENKGVSASVSQAHKKLMSSNWDKDFDFADVQNCLFAYIAENATVYVCTSHHLAASIWAWMKEWSDYSCWCTWSKPNPMPSLMKRHWTWNAELICYATRGKHIFNFPAEGHALSTWTIQKANGKSGHPTEKPVAVPEYAILHSSNTGQIVLDLFGGSGSTLIACEKVGRVSRLMELDPNYCDVIVKRWQQFTGKKAILEQTGQTYEELTQLSGLQNG